jgi:carboxyl-terminal processing protease
LLDQERRIGYVRVSAFHTNTMHEFNAALRALRTKRARGLILDLRFDPGGLMHQAVGMVDRFVDEGMILSTVTRRRAVQEYYATGPGSMTEIELAVLINASSASSAEIVAGSLQDHGRATLVGTRSFGKGSVQHLLHLTGQEAAVKVTVAYYRLPKGRTIHRSESSRQEDPWGIIPDVHVELSTEEEAAIVAWHRAIDLSADAPSHNGSYDGDTGPVDLIGATDPIEMHRDRQLVAALEILAKRLQRSEQKRSSE